MFWNNSDQFLMDLWPLSCIRVHEEGENGTKSQVDLGTVNKNAAEGSAEKAHLEGSAVPTDKKLSDNILLEITSLKNHVYIKNLVYQT